VPLVAAPKAPAVRITLDAIIEKGLDTTFDIHYNSYESSYYSIVRRKIMRTVQMTLDEELVSIVDKISRKLGTTRSAFTRDALRKAIGQFEIRKMEKKHRDGYKKKPVTATEFGSWENEQVWVD